MRFLIDTNIISEPTCAKPNPKVLNWLLQNELTSGLSTMTIGEIWKGVLLHPPGKKRTAYRKWASDIEASFQGRILPADQAVMKTWGQYCASQQNQGNHLQTIDSVIAATALHFNLTVVTRNVADFPGVPTFDPWK